MTQVKIVERITFSQVMAEAEMIFCAVKSCWWTHRWEDLHRRPDSDLPCGPRGSVLMQTADVEGFLKAAMENPRHYGKHGLRALMAAHHDNCLVGETGQHWSFATWDEYNDVLDEQLREG